MTVGEYVSVFVSIVLGLALGDLAVSLHRLLTARSRVHWDWLSPAIALITVINIVTLWWVAHHWYPGASDLTVIAFFPNFAQLILLFLAAAAAFPDEVPEEGLDLRSFYFTRSRYFWVLNLLQLAVSGLFIAPRYLDHASFERIVTYVLLNAPYGVAAALLAWSRNLWLHRVLIVLWLAYLLVGSAGFELVH